MEVQSEFRVEFYENQLAQVPYANITGSTEGFIGHVCNGFKAKHQVDVTATEEAKQHDGLFLGPDSYYKVIRIK